MPGHTQYLCDLKEDGKETKLGKAIGRKPAEQIANENVNHIDRYLVKYQVHITLQDSLKNNNNRILWEK